MSGKKCQSEIIKIEKPENSEMILPKPIQEDDENAKEEQASSFSFKPSLIQST